MYFTDKGIVLLSRNYSDSDKIFKVFTSQQGVLTVFGKGIRKINSRRSYSLDTLNYISSNFYKKGDYYYIRDVSLISDFSNIKSNIVIVSWVYYILEVLDQLLISDESDSYLYYNLISTLNNLEMNPQKRDLYRFLKKVLESQGYLNSQDYKNLKYLNKLESKEIFNEQEKILIDNYFQEKLEEISEKKINSINLIKSI